MRIELLDDAKKDLVDGFHFYHDQASGLGSYFLDSLFADIDSLLLHAGYYSMEKDVVRVRAVLDCRRSPVWLRRRLRRSNG